MKKVLVVTVHPDDETLMCGGTILKHKENGDEVNWLIITNISEQEGWGKEKVLERQNEIDQVAVAYDFNGVFKLDFPTTKLDQVPMANMVMAISKVVTEVQPDTLYLPNRSDVHSDHRIAFEAAYACTKQFRYPFIKNIMMGEALSETEFAPALPESAFIPNVFIDITPYLDKKVEIMKIYNSEVMDDWKPRSISSIESLSRYRGSRIGVKSAEAFVCLLLIP